MRLHAVQYLIEGECSVEVPIDDLVPVRKTGETNKDFAH
jgi:hypothetical protein